MSNSSSFINSLPNITTLPDTARDIPVSNPTAASLAAAGQPASASRSQATTEPAIVRWLLITVALLFLVLSCS